MYRLEDRLHSCATTDQNAKATIGNTKLINSLRFLWFRSDLPPWQKAHPAWKRSSGWVPFRLQQSVQTANDHAAGSTGITVYHNVDTIERMADHSNAKTTGLYERRNDDIRVGEVEKSWDLIPEICLSDRVKQGFLVLRFLVAESGRYALRPLKNCVKALLGRELCVDERGLFLRQYVLHLTGLRRIRAVTCVGRSGREGPGSQALAIMRTINFARSSGLVYVHTPFIQLHGAADRSMKDWVTGWEALFNLGAGEIACDVGGTTVNCCNSWLNLELCFGWHGRTEQLAHRFEALIPEFRRKYYLSGHPRVTKEVTVAVSIRRGDVSADSYPGLFTRTEVILQTVSDVKSILDARDITYRIDLYSNGKSGEFQDFSRFGAVVHTNPDVDVFWTMRELIEADILIVAKSSFSYYAALISDGIKIFESPGRPRLTPFTDWIPCGADGSIDRLTFERQVSILMQTKAGHIE